MIIHDISLTVTTEDAMRAGTEQGLTVRWTDQVGVKGAHSSLSVLTVGAHMGTHIESPLHFVPGGLTTDALDLNTLVGPAEVVEIYGRSPITAADLEHANIAPKAERVLLKTDNTRFLRLRDPKFQADYTGLAPSGAEWLIHHGIRLVGMDYLSVGPYGPANMETHKILLGAGVVVLESLMLDKIAAGEYLLMALPPKFAGLEASPCRCVLVEGGLR